MSNVALDSRQDRLMRWARLFSDTLTAYVVVWGAAFAYFVIPLGTIPVLMLSLMIVLPLLVGIRMRLRWGSVKLRELGFFAIFMIASTWGTTAVVHSWQTDAGFSRTIFAPRTEEEIRWNNFKKELSKDAAFRHITITYLRHVHWAEVSLNSEDDLDRLIAIANQCGIKDRRLDGPYVHSISITIPGSKGRSEAYH